MQNFFHTCTLILTIRTSFTKPLHYLEYVFHTTHTLHAEFLSHNPYLTCRISFTQPLHYMQNFFHTAHTLHAEIFHTTHKLHGSISFTQHLRTLHAEFLLHNPYITCRISFKPHWLPPNKTQHEYFFHSIHSDLDIIRSISLTNGIIIIGP